MIRLQAATRLRNFSVKARMTILAAICLVAVLSTVLIGSQGTSRLTQVSERVFVSKDVVADILPPPMYLIEVRLLVSRLLEKTITADAAEAELTRLTKDYQARVDYWTQNPPYGLEQHLLGPQHEFAKEFLAKVKDVVDRARAQGPDAARAELPQIHALYEKHRQGVDVTVERGNGFAAQEIAAFQETVSNVRQLLLAVLGSVAVLFVGLFTIFIRSVTLPLRSSVNSIHRIETGDLCQRIQVEGRDEFSAMSQALSNMQSGLQKIVSNVRMGSESLAIASAEIAQGNLDLSNRTERQAASLQQTAASLDQLNDRVRQNAGNAKSANELAIHAAAVAQKCGEVVGEMVTTMKGVSEASRRISEITSVIDGIAFQTNILALNAAVEAARAGNQGRGFAVVANEVRTLAGRSASAAKEIKVLIGANMERVQEGNQLVDRAGSTMQEVVHSIGRVTEIMGEISVATTEQATEVTQLSGAIGHLDEATQQNSALVEEMAAAAEGLRSSSRDLVNLVSLFKLEEAMLAPQQGVQTPWITSELAPAY